MFSSSLPDLLDVDVAGAGPHLDRNAAAPNLAANFAVAEAPLDRDGQVPVGVNIARVALRFQVEREVRRQMERDLAGTCVEPPSAGWTASAQ